MIVSTYSFKRTEKQGGGDWCYDHVRQCKMFVISAVARYSLTVSQKRCRALLSNLLRRPIERAKYALGSRRGG